MLACGPPALVGNVMSERLTAEEESQMSAPVCVVADFTAVQQKPEQKKSRSFTLGLQWSPSPVGKPLVQPEFPTYLSHSKEGAMLSEKNEVLLLKPPLALPSTWTIAVRFRIHVRRQSQQEFANIAYGYDEFATEVVDDSSHVVVVRREKRALLGVYSQDQGFIAAQPDVDLQVLGKASYHQDFIKGPQLLTPWVTVVAVGSAGRTEFTVECSGCRLSATAAMQIREPVAGIGNLHGADRSQGVGLLAWAAIAQGRVCDASIFLSQAAPSAAAIRAALEAPAPSASPAATGAALEAPAPSASPASTAEPTPFIVGAHVELTNFMKDCNHHLIGERGKIRQIVDDKFEVRLAKVGTGGQPLVIKTKATHLMLVDAADSAMGIDDASTASSPTTPVSPALLFSHATLPADGLPLSLPPSVPPSAPMSSVAGSTGGSETGSEACPSRPVDSQSHLAAGSMARIVGLLDSEYNGKKCKVINAPDSRRYKVEIGKISMHLLAQNLELVSAISGRSGASSSNNRSVAKCSTVGDGAAQPRTSSRISMQEQADEHIIERSISSLDDNPSVIKKLNVIGQFLAKNFRNEHQAFAEAAAHRETPDIFVRSMPIEVGLTGIDGAIVHGDVAFKESSASVRTRGAKPLSLGQMLDDLSTDGVEAMQELVDQADKGLDAHVSVCGSNSELHERTDVHGEKKTMRLSEFAQQGKGAVHAFDQAQRPPSGHLKDANFNRGNWSRHMEYANFSKGLQLMHAPFLTRTHRDSSGVYPWLKQIAGISLFVVWSLGEGVQAELTEECDDSHDRTWGTAEWTKFFSLQSSRLMLVFPGDVAFLKAGAFHRVFTLKTKVHCQHACPVLKPLNLPFPS